MRPRNCIPATGLLALAALTCVGLEACRTPVPETSPTYSTGNIVITVTPKNVKAPELLLTYWTDSGSAFSAYMSTVGENFRLVAGGDWYDLEETSLLQVVEIDGEPAVVLTDSKNESIEVQSKLLGIDGEAGSNYASSAWLGQDLASGAHTFVVYITYKDMLFVFEVKADG